MKIQKTSPEWEGYAKDTKWHVVDEQGNVLLYTYTKRDAQEWIDAVTAERDDEYSLVDEDSWGSTELNVGQWS